MQARTKILLSALAALSSPAVYAQADDADAAEIQRETELEVARIQREAETAAQEAAAAQAIESQVESARREMEAARIQLERAAREVVVQTQGGYVFLDENGVRRGGAPGYTTFLNAFEVPGARAQIGAVLVDAEGGALVTQISEDSAAADAGLKVGDVIHSIDGIDLADGSGSAFEEITTRLSAIEPGATVQLVVERGGEDLAVGVETQAGSPFGFVFGPNSDSLVFLRAERAAAEGAYARALNPIRLFNMTGAPWGDMELVPITPALGRYFETTEGLLVVRAPSDDSVGLQDGDVILAIGDRTPTSAEHAIRILGSFEPGEVIEFSLMRDARRQPLQYTVEESDFQFNGPSVIVAPAAPAAPGSASATRGTRGAAAAAPGAPGARGPAPAAPGTPAPARPATPVSPTSP